MTNLYDFIYCIDKNFNHQAYLSIASLLKTNTSGKYSINIIHKNPKSFRKYLKKLNFLFPNQNISLIKFKFDIKNYPKLKNSHVSEATYYRMFIYDHIENPANFLIYIDADAYFLNDIGIKIHQIINNLINNDLPIAAKTEFANNDFNFSKKQEEFKSKFYQDVFERLSVNQKYFNAGVLIINSKKWKKDDISSALKKKVIDLNEKIIFWDQDVLNSFINGNYYELPIELNYLVDIKHSENLKEKKIDIVHYAGKLKPWTKEGLGINPNTYYQSINSEYPL